MVSLDTAKLAGVVMILSIVVIAGTNLAFAEQPCVKQAYVYNVGCLPLDTAHMVGGVIVVSILFLPWRGGEGCRAPLSYGF
jgi:hypothetical protein